jgi:hypothetical protein
VLSHAAADASNCRLYLATQCDWAGHKGFYLDMEGGQLASLPLNLAVADGQDWHITSKVPGFVQGREYHVKAQVGPAQAVLWLDGAEVGETKGAWEPLAANLTLNERPGWANEVGDWMCTVRRLETTLTHQGKRPVKTVHDFSDMASRPLELRFFEPCVATTTALEAQRSDSLTVELWMSFGPSDHRPYAPFIDRYGQCRYADFPGKVTADEQLVQDMADEDARLAQIPPSADHDKYGGYRKGSWHEAPTGFFRTLKRDGRWWLVSPRGNPCFFTGLCGGVMDVWEATPITGREYLFEWLPPRDGVWQEVWQRHLWSPTDETDYVALYACNLARKYGEGWRQKAAERYLRRARALGFTGGKWAAPRGTVDIPVLNLAQTPKLVEHPDVFDPAVCEALARDLAAQIAPRRNDSWVLGWSVGNEYGEIIKRAEVRQILAMPETTPARGALVEYALRELYAGDEGRLRAAWKLDQGAAPAAPDADVEQMRRLYEDRYYAALYAAVKAADPNHLYLGNWIVPGWWEDEEDWRIHARHLDVIGYDRYAPTFSDERLLRLQAETDKPTFCGEWGIPQWYDGRRGFGMFGVHARDEAESGELYCQWVRDAARDPHCVGLSWFLYRDQPLTGRGPSGGDGLVCGEHWAFGIVDGTDRVKWDLVTRMREANLQAARWKLEAGD